MAFLKSSLFDNRSLPLAAMLLGLALNLSGIDRPAMCTDILHTLVFVGTIVSGVAVGLLFEGERLFEFPKENLFSLIFRSTIYPLFFYGCARLFGLDNVDTAILVLYAIVPAGIYSNLIADLFNLDRALANSVYILSSAVFLIIVLPVYLVVVAGLA